MRSNIIFLSLVMTSAIFMATNSYSFSAEKPKAHTGVVDRVLGSVPGAVQIEKEYEDRVADAWNEQYEIPDGFALYVTCIVTEGIDASIIRDIIDIETEKMNYYPSQLWAAYTLKETDNLAGSMVYIRNFEYPMHKYSPIFWRVVFTGNTSIVCGSTVHTLKELKG